SSWVEQCKRKRVEVKNSIRMIKPEDFFMIYYLRFSES
ncbi:unnamed protein product, partial [marine sediment metagenome]